MELPPPHVLLQLDAIIVAQRESDGNSPPPVMAPPAPPPASTPRALAMSRSKKVGEAPAKAVSA